MSYYIPTSQEWSKIKSHSKKLARIATMLKTASDELIDLADIEDTRTARLFANLLMTIRDRIDEHTNEIAKILKI